jgi:hypothetical protein
VGVLKALLRVHAYIFEGLLAAFFLAIAILALSSDTPLNLGFLPWKGDALPRWLVGSCLFGLVSLVLALAGKLRVLFFLWSLAVMVMLFRGFFLSPYSFTGPVNFKGAVYLTLAALFAAIGAWPSTRRRRPVRRPMKY